MGKFSLRSIKPTLLVSYEEQRREKSKRNKRGALSLLLVVCGPLLGGLLSSADQSLSEAVSLPAALIRMGGLTLALLLCAVSLCLGLLSSKVWSGRLAVILSLPELFFGVFFFVFISHSHP